MKIADPTQTVGKLKLSIELSIDEAEALRVATKVHGRSTWKKMAKDILVRVLKDDLVGAVLDET